MATLARNEFDVPTTPIDRDDDFLVVVSDRSLGRNTPQRVASRLWAPMLAMALIAFPAAFVLALVRSSLIGDGATDVVAIAQLQHLTAAVMFTGFLAVLSAITFAVARILGEFRSGGGLVQESAGVRVQTLRMPAPAKGMLALMMAGMMAVLIPVVLHVVAAAAIVGPAEADLLRSERWFEVLEGIRRLGVAAFLLGISLGLGTIVHVLRFQATHIREVADEVGSSR